MTCNMFFFHFLGDFGPVNGSRTVRERFTGHPWTGHFCLPCAPSTFLFSFQDLHRKKGPGEPDASKRIREIEEKLGLEEGNGFCSQRLGERAMDLFNKRELTKLNIECAKLADAKLDKKLVDLIFLRNYNTTYKTTEQTTSTSLFAFQSKRFVTSTDLDWDGDQMTLSLAQDSCHLLTLQTSHPTTQLTTINCTLGELSLV